jgi:hypothetical protein
VLEFGGPTPQRELAAPLLEMGSTTDRPSLQVCDLGRRVAPAATIHPGGIDIVDGNHTVPIRGEHTVRLQDITMVWNGAYFNRWNPRGRMGNHSNGNRCLSSSSRHHNYTYFDMDRGVQTLGLH